MSWFETLAAKTENLLNKVDQVAGQALQNTPDKNNSSDESQWKRSLGATDGSLVTTELNVYKPPVSKRSEKVTNTSKTPKNNCPEDPDHKLFEFLNSSPPLPPTSSLSNKLTASKNSYSNLLKFTNDNTDKTQELKEFENDKQDDRGSAPAEETTSTAKSVVYKQDGTNNDNEVLPNPSAIEFENQLLKSEINSLNIEMQSILTRAQNNQEDRDRTIKKMELQNQQMIKKEQIIRELQERESDLTKALDAKDTQLSVLRVRLEEADASLKLKNKKIQDIQVEKENLLQDHSLSTGVQTHALDTLQDKLKEAELMVRQEADRYSTLLNESQEKIRKLESDRDNLTCETSNLQRTLAREKEYLSVFVSTKNYLASVVDMMNQVRAAKTLAETAKQELSQYKDKATRILQSKDRLIATLKEGQFEKVDGSGASEPSIQATELESLKQERDVLRDDYNSCHLALQNLRTEFMEVESQMQQEIDSLKEQMRMMEEQLDGERKRREDVETDVNKYKQVVVWLIA
ncbi:hypothetical protein HELRODRAFT_171793 [Helobdella robusta]|uniref:Uncharacterized protein n=1 Tax=Helobdella robusta TaxID=6412 RepID=T1F4P3_HELRO|nr:hypothetical protein HELRODRAFT_171793 [Helobdella robusta]ESO05398.1 hypothetical protein HELRODRAFT_171793 [Helobdella robusta]